MKKFSFVAWFLDRAAGTYLSLALLLLGGIAFAATPSSVTYTVHDVPDMTLNVRISATQTAGIKVNPPQLNGSTMTYPTTSGGILQLKQGTRTEQIYYSRATVNTATKVFTLTGTVIRDICWNGTTAFTSCNNGQIFTPGATVREVIDARLLNLAAHVDIANTFTASGALTFSGSGSLGWPTYATTAIRDQELGASPSGPIRGACVTASGLCYLSNGGVWTAIGNSTTPNATTTVAGKGEVATVTDTKNNTIVGDSGGPIFISTDITRRTSTGATQFGKIPVLGPNGSLDPTLTGSGSPSNLKYLRGDGSWQIASIPTTTFGDGSDGAVALSATTTLTRDMSYGSLNLNGQTLHMAGFKVYVNGILSGAGVMDATSGGNGGNGSVGGTGNPGAGGGGGTAGAAPIVTGSLPKSTSGFAGVTGGAGVLSGGGTTPATGVPTIVANSLGFTAGVYGGSGGVSSGTTGGGSVNGGFGSGGSVLFGGHNTYVFLSQFLSTSGSTLVPLNGSARSGAGGGGAGAGCTSQPDPAGGGGGGSGAEGGHFFIAAKTVTGTFTVQSLGGNGGNGGAGSQASSCDSGGGGGGSGGPGGSGILEYNDKSGWSGSFVLTGGTGGTGGVGGTVGSATEHGYPGKTGASGIAIQAQVN